jgi:mono/diheme cytochrome c family protein
MNRFYAIGLLALLIVIAALPVYALYESARMEDVQARLQQQFVTEGVDLYVENCATCHGTAGEGVGAMPPLNVPGLTGADRDLFYEIIAHSPHGTAMNAWHVDEGGKFNSYQVEGLVTFITDADWARANALADVKGIAVPTPATPDKDLATMEATGENPHECRACHEEPDVHAERFGLDCSRCHTLEAWQPALLVRHTFLLDHGGEGEIACQTCHTHTYSEHTCYECHEHDIDQIRTVHVAEEIDDFDYCAECHPTGREGEAAFLGYGRSGKALHEQPSGGDSISQRGGGQLLEEDNAEPPVLSVPIDEDLGQ